MIKEKSKKLMINKSPEELLKEKKIFDKKSIEGVQ
jgi:hypothetical protein